VQATALLATENRSLPCAQTQSDMRLIFDECRRRFWTLDGGGIYGTGQCRGIFLVSVSKSEDPADGWYLYWFDVVAH
jgi:hypothetical protein